MQGRRGRYTLPRRMTTDAPEPLPVPAVEGEETVDYVIHPRSKRMFHGFLDSHNLLPPGRTYKAHVVTWYDRSAAPKLGVAVTMEMHGGRARETVECDADRVLIAKTFTRTVYDASDEPCREERADFTRGPVALPRDSYPEVALPFLLRYQPFDRRRRALHAWIVDRFVAKVYCEVAHHTKVEVPAGRFDVHEVVMYPDLNDWVHLGRVLTELARPLLPKYRMWFERAAPHRLVRFEGPYGPPGAPEIVLELV